MAAAARVFATYEILESILLYLPLRHLLLSQKINKSSYDVVNRSQNVQRALFLDAGSAQTVFVDGDFVSSTDYEASSRWKDAISGDAVFPVVNPFIIM